MRLIDGLKFGIWRVSSMAAVALLVACAPEPAAEDQATQNIAAGAGVFSANCAACHGEGGGGPALSEIRALSPAERGARIRAHPQAGPVIDRMSAKQILQLLDYFKNASPEAMEPTGPNAQVFLQYCGYCHGDTGRGPSFAELNAVPPDQFEQQLRNHPTAGAIPQRLTANDLAKLLAFFDSK